MEDISWLSVLERLKLATNSATDSDLADNLKLTKQAIAQAKAKKSIPSSWVQKTATTFTISADWLFFGTGSMYRGKSVQAEKNPQPSTAAIPACAPCPPCSRCALLEQKMELLEAERRELSAENRQLWRENKELMVTNIGLQQREEQGKG